LGPGERDAICLALEFEASLLLIDDLPGRLAAERRNIQFTGTLAILFQAALMNDLDYDLKLEELKLLGFRSSDSVLDKMRDRFERARTEGSQQK
jgi:predicted nucleic acid-binding protein